MRLLNAETYRIESFVGRAVPPYSILSHTWGADEDEISLQDIQGYNFVYGQDKAGRGRNLPVKVAGCCQQTLKDGRNYVWIDTCCIDKTNAVELSEAINSMYQWYANASTCYVYLADVSAQENPRLADSRFAKSRWFQRGWTLQELLAPKGLQFYDSEWNIIGSRSDLSAVVERIAGIPRPFLLGWASPHVASVAQRMSWASNRHTKRIEDAAYCLLGVFGVTMTMIYGEGLVRAFTRLQEEIVKHIPDETILAWSPNPTQPVGAESAKIAGRIFATSPAEFADCGNIISRAQGTFSIEIVGTCLHLHMIGMAASSTVGIKYGILNCGPGNTTNYYLAIPLIDASASTRSIEYCRAKCLRPKKFSKNEAEMIPQTAFVRMGLHQKLSLDIDSRRAFYVEVSLETGMEVTDVAPRDCWQSSSSIITLGEEPGGDLMRHIFIRFRALDGESPDFVAVLEVEYQASPTMTRCHLMTSARDMVLDDLSKRFPSMRSESREHTRASNGTLSVRLTVYSESVAGQAMFVVRLKKIPKPPQVTINASLELELLDTLVNIDNCVQRMECVAQERQSLIGLSQALSTELASTRENLKRVTEQLKQLETIQSSLKTRLEKGEAECQELLAYGSDTLERQSSLEKHGSKLVGHLEDLLKTREGTDTSKFLAEMLFGAFSSGHLQLAQLILCSDNAINLMDEDGWTALHYATLTGNTSIVKYIIEKGVQRGFKVHVDVVSPFMLAVLAGYEDIVMLLLTTDGNIIHSKDSWHTHVAYRVIESLFSMSKGTSGDSVSKTEDSENRKHSPTTQVRNSHTEFERLLSRIKRRNIKWMVQKQAAYMASNLIDGRYATIIRVLRTSFGYNAKLLSKPPSDLSQWDGDSAVSQLLLSTDSDSEETLQGRSLAYAAFCNDTVSVAKLSENRVSTKFQTSRGMTALIIAANRGNADTVRCLLDHGALVNGYDYELLTPLHWSAALDHGLIVDILLEKGADLEAREELGQTPLHLAASAGHRDVVKLLIEKGAFIEASSNHVGDKPLALACKFGHGEVVRYLVQMGASVRTKRPVFGTRSQVIGHITPLWLAVDGGFLDCVEILLGHEPGIEVSGPFGRTPLALAARRGNKAIVEALLAHGADITTTDDQGRTPAQLAVINRHSELVPLLSPSQMAI
jgi:ankyrin repeat protein